jgi:hypothetical protein
MGCQNSAIEDKYVYILAHRTAAGSQQELVEQRMIEPVEM